MDFSEIETQIVDAAGKAFDRYSIQKTTVEDICKEAAVSRPTFYRFFKNKDDLILKIASHETARLSENVAAFVRKYPDIEDAFVEAMVLVTMASEKSHVVKFLLSSENFDYTLKLVSHQPNLWVGQLTTWEALYNAAKEQGRVHADLKSTDVALWLSLIRMMFVIFSRSMEINKRQTRKLIKQFVIRSILLPKPVDTA